MPKAVTPAKIIVRWPYTAVIAAAFAVAFSIIFVGSEDHVYTWDFRYYWQAYYELGDLIRVNFSLAVKQVLSQIWSNEYNPTPILLLVPVEFVFGHAREAYIAALAVLYVVPAAFAAARLADTAASGANENDEASIHWRKLTLFQILAVLFPPLWTPTLRGYPDVIGVLPLAVAGYFVLQTEVTSSINVKRAVLLGFLLWLPFLFRKWYAYSIIAFFLSACFFSLYLSFRAGANHLWRNIIIRIFGFYAISGMVLVLLVFLVQYRLAIHAVTTSYADINAPWQVSSAEHILAFGRYFGLIWIIAAAAGLIAPAITRRCFPATLFVGMNIIFTFLLFTHTQAFGMQHYLPVALWLYVLGCLAISQFVFMLSTVRQTAVIFCILSLAGAFFYATYLTLPGRSLPLIDALLPMKLDKIKLANYPTYKKLLADLSQNMHRDDTFSVYASSYILSDSLIHALADDELDRRLVYASQVDRRDHFDVRSLLTRFVMVAEPIQVHLSEDAQHVITEPANRILKGVGIGKAYRKLPNEYELADGVKASIFEKKRLFTLDEVDDLFNALLTFYPEWRRESHLKTLLLTADISVGDKVGIIYPETVAHSEAIDELVIHPGETTESSLSVPKWEVFMQSYSGVEMFIPERFSACSGAEGADVEIKLASQELWHGTILPGHTERVTFPSDLAGLFEIHVHSDGGAACDEMHVKFLSRQ